MPLLLHPTHQHHGDSCTEQKANESVVSVKVGSRCPKGVNFGKETKQSESCQEICTLNQNRPLIVLPYSQPRKRYRSKCCTVSAKQTQTIRCWNNRKRNHEQPNPKQNCQVTQLSLIDFLRDGCSETSQKHHSEKSPIIAPIAHKRCSKKEQN